MRRDYYQEAQGAILVYDITRKQTFNELDEWLENLRNYCGDIPCILMGNKTDMADKREVQPEDGKKYADEKKLPFLETSASSGMNVEDAFKKLSDLILEKS
ncbi:MAG: GTP-binding protein [Candidatus Lokiarchaeota archaeon]|nr:GTP-binding protein [Candidatus Lokiarchaeota archaeon]